MKNRSNILKIALVAIVISSLSCKNSKKLPEGVHEINVKEVIQTSSYTYLRVNEEGVEQWLAVTAMIASVGETYYYKGGIKMTDFPSKELNRTFKEILFLDELRKTADFPKKENISINPSNSISVSDSTPGSMTKKTIEKINVNIKPVKGGITIAELYSKKTNYAGKTVKIRGQVTKFNPEIMNRNWIHIQDGTELAGEFDLAVTSNIQVKVGEIVTLEGKISLNKDFGYGYIYTILMEDATLVK